MSREALLIVWALVIVAVAFALMGCSEPAKPRPKSTAEWCAEAGCPEALPPPGARQFCRDLPDDPACRPSRASRR